MTAVTTATATVRVVGAPRSGVTSLVGALRQHLAGHVVVEGTGAIKGTDVGESATGAPPALVVVACSAVAPLTGSDCAAIDVHARSVDAVIAVLTKVDAHRRWRAVLAANRAALATHHPRYRDLSWVVVAAAPDVGQPDLDALVTAVRNPSAIPRLPPHGALSGASPAGSRRVSGVVPRDELQRLRIRLGRHLRRGCTELRNDFRDRAAHASRADATFEVAFGRAAQQVLTDLRDRIGVGLGDVAEASGVTTGVTTPDSVPAAGGPELPPPPSRGAAAESRLTLALGVGFGLGVAATVGRIVTALAPGLTVAAVTVAVVVGCGLTAWLVATRALLHRRALLDRWVTEATVAVRSHGEDVIADALLDARTAWSRRTGP